MPLLACLLAVGSAAPCLLATVASASPVRVATLGGDERLLLDNTNLFRHPALVREFAHVGIELFDDWAAIAVPLGQRHGVGLFLNRPTPATGALTEYLDRAGGRLLRSLEPRPWLDAVYGVRWNAVSIGLGVRHAYDVRDLGVREASASHWEARLGAAIGPARRRLEATVVLERVDLSQRGEPGDPAPREETGGPGLGLDLRGRWGLSGDALLLPSFSWQRSEAGLAPQARQRDAVQAALAWNARPVPAVLALAAVMVSGERETLDDPATGRTRTSLWRLPAVVVGGEAQVGSLVVRLGLRHESRVTEHETPDAVDLGFDAGVAVDVGLGFEFGDLAVDGALEKNFLRDGPEFLAGSPHGGGLLTTLSLVYRFYR